MVRIRAFRAVSDFESSQKFIEGHQRVLTSIGVTEVSSAKHEWAYNPASFVILVESLDDGRALGGARIHAVGGTQPLPIEEAVGEFDGKIYDLVEKYQINGTGELCGLWNSMEVAGMGIGSIFLTRAAVAISSQIGLNSLFALCASYTVKMAESVGFAIERSIGNNGTFYYPKLNLLATTVFLENTSSLCTANQHDRERIFSLRENPDQKATEVGRKSMIDIEYKLCLSDSNSNEFKFASPSSLCKLSSLKLSYAGNQ